MSRARGVATIGDSADISTWSGIPYSFLRAGRQDGFLKDGLDLRMAHSREMRLVWQASQLLRGHRARGFQYCRPFLDRLGRTALDECRRLEVQEVISHYQLLPVRYLLAHSVKTAFYIDTTLEALFATHGMFAWLNSQISEEAIDSERAEYHAATRIVTMAGWVRTSLQQTYGVPAERIHTVLPGANLPEDAVRRKLTNRGPSATPDCFSLERPLRLGFTGKDWKRKGLPRLVGAVELLNQAGVPAEVIVIGNLPRQYRDHCYVHAAGFIDKTQESSRFVDIVESCDLGCAPSYEEPMGIAPLEYLRLGVPVLCTEAGGLRDVCDAAGAAAILLKKDATAKEIAIELENIVRSSDCLRQMRAVAWERKEYFSWDRTVRQLQQVWNS